MMKRLIVVSAAALTACGASPPPEDAPPPPPPIFALVVSQPLTAGHYLRVYRHIRTGECFVVTVPSTYQSGSSVTAAPRSVCEG